MLIFFSQPTGKISFISAFLSHVYMYEFYVWEGVDSLKGPYWGEKRIQKLKLSANVLLEKFSEHTLVWYG